MAGIDSNWQGAFVGAFIILAVLIGMETAASAAELFRTCSLREGPLEDRRQNDAAPSTREEYLEETTGDLGDRLAAMTIGSTAFAQNIFALVPKNMNNPFFDQARDGCKKAEAESGGKFDCEYIGPGEHGGGDEQVQIVQDLIARGVEGIGISPANAAAMSVAAQAAKDAGIPLITWDSDLLPEDQGLRVAYIGTHNYEIGVNLAKRVQEIKPKGGTICIQSGGAAAANHNERMQGIRDTLAGVTGTTTRAIRWPARTAGPRRRAARSTPTTTSRSRCSSSKTIWRPIPTSTPSCPRAASRSSSRTPTARRSSPTRARSRTARWRSSSPTPCRSRSIR